MSLGVWSCQKSGVGPHLPHPLGRSAGHIGAFPPMGLAGVHFWAPSLVSTTCVLPLQAVLPCESLSLSSVAASYTPGWTAIMKHGRLAIRCFFLRPFWGFSIEPCWAVSLAQTLWLGNVLCMPASPGAGDGLDSARVGGGGGRGRNRGPTNWMPFLKLFADGVQNVALDT